MHRIDVFFHRLEDRKFAELFESIGVYVIWGSQADRRPTYIGEGDIFNRFASHRKRFPKPLRGYIAEFDGILKQSKEKAEIIEAILLHIATETNRCPSKNVKQGKSSNIRKILKDNNILKIYFDGHDPFIHPEDRQAKYIKEVRISFKDQTIDFDWKKI